MTYISKCSDQKEKINTTIEYLLQSRIWIKYKQIKESKENETTISK